VAEYLGRSDDPATRPAGARPVALFALFTPLSPTEGGN
jgi:hypothetical protein